MFEDQPLPNQTVSQSTPAGAPPRMPEPEDILGDVDQTTPNVKGPSTIPSTMGTPLVAALRPTERPTMKEPVGNGIRKVVVAVVIAALLIGVFGGAAYYLYTLLQPKITTQTLVNTSPLPRANTNTVVNQNQPVNQNANVPINENANVVPQPIDTDRDGLTDDEEKLYGTNPNEIDTDHDGLTDRDEVKVFGTNPLNADTDGDGYLDGAEVRAGFDPKGPGRLLKIE